MYSVRGKRRKTTTAGEQDKVRNGKRGRPMKSVDQLVRFRREVNSELHSLDDNDNVEELEIPNKLSRLEQLPNELLQLIFFYCFETNLPNASIHLARALSTELTYKVLILFAYFDDDGEYPVETKLFLPATYRLLDIDEKMRLQRSITMCRWFTLERVHSCLPALGWLAMYQAWHQEQVSEKVCFKRIKAQNSAYLEDEGVPTVSETHKLLPRLDNFEAMKKHYMLMKIPPLLPEGSVDIEPWADYHPRITTWLFSPTAYSKTVGNNHSGLRRVGNDASILSARFLPAWLLKGGPWTDRKVIFLRLLHRGQKYILRDGPFYLAATALFEGMADAIRTKHLVALEALLDLHGTAKERGAKDFQSIDGGSIAYRLPVHLFHLASKAGAQNSEIMQCLVNYDIYSVPRDDDVLTGWALRQDMKGDEVARTMLIHMREPNEHYCSDPDFYSGEGNGLFD